MRLGWMSLARMEPETSIAIITVARCEGSETMAVGRATASSSSVIAHSSRAGGK